MATDEGEFERISKIGEESPLQKKIREETEKSK
jgi:hypothetical protein